MKPYLCLVVFVWLAACTKKPIPPLKLKGYTDKLSYYPGDTAKVYLSANRVAETTLKLLTFTGTPVFEKKVKVTPQPSTTKRPWRDGFGYRLSFKFRVPSVPSGVYFWNGEIPFLVKSKSTLPITVVWDSNTVHAYNWMGGKSMYYDEPATRVSFRRATVRKEAFHFTRGCLGWWEKDPFFQKRAHYLADVDLEDYQLFDQSQLLVLIGHSEYWTRKARQNFDRFIASGKPALILSGNTMYWQVRYNNEKTQMIGYKDQWDPEPVNLLHKTIRWSEPQLNYPTHSSIGLNFLHGGYGRGAQWEGYKIALPNSPLLRGLGIKRGDLLRFETHEHDGAPFIGYDKAGIPQFKPEGDPYRWEALAYSPLKSDSGEKTIGAWIAMQKTPSSGPVINTGTTNWCSDAVLGKDGKLIKKITRRMASHLLEKKNIFTEPTRKSVL